MQDLSRKGYVSKPPLPEAREANRLHAEAVKKRKDAAKETQRQRSHAPAAGGRSPAPAATTGRRTPAFVTPAGGRTSAASTEMPEQMAPRVQVDPRVTSPGQSSGGVGIPRDRRSSTGKHSLSSLSE